MASLNRWRRRLQCESGAEIVEFAFTLPLLLLLMLGIIEFGFMFREYEVVTNAAREGARIAILPSYDEEDVRARVQEYLETAGLDWDLADVPPFAAAPTPVGAGGACVSMVPVTVTYSHPVPFVSGIAAFFGSAIGTVTLTATSSMRTEVAAGTC
jgi:Flp pilus assembly protein TadG